LLGWLQKRRTEANKRRAIKIGTAVVERVNVGIEQWRAERLELRREMSSNDFDERIVGLEPQEGLSYEELLEIEALAFMKNWYEQHDKIIGETKFYISDDDLDCIDIIGGQERLVELLGEAFREVSSALEAHVDQSIAEAIKVRAKRG
jgi:hypothetical protein